MTPSQLGSRSSMTLSFTATNFSKATVVCRRTSMRIILKSSWLFPSRRSFAVLRRRTWTLTNPLALMTLIATKGGQQTAIIANATTTWRCSFPEKVQLHAHIARVCSVGQVLLIVCDKSTSSSEYHKNQNNMIKIYPGYIPQLEVRAQVLHDSRVHQWFLNDFGLAWTKSTFWHELNGSVDLIARKTGCDPGTQNKQSAIETTWLPYWLLMYYFLLYRNLSQDSCQILPKTANSIIHF